MSRFEKAKYRFFFKNEEKPTEMARSLTATPEPGIPPYGTAPVKPSLAWTDIKLDEVKKFMKIEKVGAALLPAPFIGQSQL